MIKNLDPNTQGGLVALGSALLFSLFMLVISSGDEGAMALFLGGLLILAVVAVFVVFNKKIRRAGMPMTDSDNEIEEESKKRKESPALFSVEEKSPEQDSRSLKISQTLSEFGVPAQVVSVKRGPRLTQFGIEPGFTDKKERDGTVKRRKIKTNLIYGLEDDLALALAVENVRLARVPGQSYIGLEVPNEYPQIVPQGSILNSAKGVLPIALGADVIGQPVTADITRMPHALIAGATNSGKSICIHTILASLLRFGPEKVRLLLVDPKRVELVQYNGIPHLLEPVITDMQKTVGALERQVKEMERRLELLSQVGKRNLESYNKWAVEVGRKKLAYRIIILDELADLMMAHKEEVEPLLERLAQIARATGLHLILATQRPTVDVVTGLIKANVPTRIAFAVASSIDSRVILDANGAEKLLGRGDGLYLASDASEPVRMQGGFISDQELEQLIKHWRNKVISQPLAPRQMPLADETDNYESESKECLPPAPLTEKSTPSSSQIHSPEEESQEQELLLNLHAHTDQQDHFGINATEKLLRQVGFKITRQMRTDGTIKAISELLKAQS